MKQITNENQLRIDNYIHLQYYCSREQKLFHPDFCKIISYHSDFSYIKVYSLLQQVKFNVFLSFIIFLPTNIWIPKYDIYYAYEADDVITI